jgi:mannose-6-phosphate isomerase-like protein (cupin superfamily)
MIHKIIDKAQAAHYLWGNNCDSWILVNTDELSIKQESMPSGAKEKLHFHKHAQQFFFVLKGVASFYVGHQKVIVGEQKGLHILPKTEHYIANETNETIAFLVISQPNTNNDRIVVDV